MTLTAVAYFRDSGGATQELSVPQQEASALAWCQQRGITVTRVFADVARSAKYGVIGREQFQAMITYMLEGSPEKTVIFWDYSRWARELLSGLKYLIDLRMMGVQVISIVDPIPDGPYGLFIEVAKLMSAEEDNRRKSASVKRGLIDSIRRNNAYPRARPPVGFIRERFVAGTRRDGNPRYNGRLVPDPATAPLARQAFEMAAEGRTLIEIMMTTGLQANVSAMAGMLRNPVYAGDLVYGGEYFADHHEALISRELFESVQKRLAERSFHPRQERSSYLLSGMVVCGSCGRPAVGAMSSGSAQGYHSYYRCNSHSIRDVNVICHTRGVKADVLERDVLEALLGIIQDPAILREVAAEQARMYAEGKHELNSLMDAQQGRLADLAVQIKRVVHAITLAPESGALVEKLKELEADQSAAKAELAVLGARSPAGIDPEQVERMRVELGQKLENADRRLQQLLLRGLRTRVTFYRSRERNTSSYYAEVSFDFGVQIRRMIGKLEIIGKALGERPI